jgi:hypothetical protein
MPVRVVRWISLVGIAVSLSALAAHVLELPNKLTLDGPLWLAVQQNIYSGWGPVLGPFEVGGTLATWVLLYLVRDRPRIALLTLVAAVCLTIALGAFFVLNAPVNAAFAAWTPETLPGDWPRYRLRWEIGHALRFVLQLIAFIALMRAMLVDALERARGHTDDSKERVQRHRLGTEGGLLPGKARGELDRGLGHGRSR